MIDLSESIGSSVPVIHGLSFSLPPKLETFFCDDSTFRFKSNSIPRSHVLKVDLSDNPLICSCETLPFVKWMTQRKDMFVSQQRYKCSSQSGWLYNENVFEILSQLQQKCTSHFGLAMGLFVSVTSFLCILCASILYRYRWKLRYLYYIARGRYRNVDLIQQGNDKEYEYNAFISYADEDRDFALHMFIEKLEREGNLQLCLHHRDFIPGEPIAANILSAIQKSKFVVIVLSPNFLDSYWCRYEFEMARMEGLYTERNMVVLVKYQEVLPNLVPRDLLYMMHTQTFLEYPQIVDDQDTFWIALKDALVTFNFIENVTLRHFSILDYPDDRLTGPKDELQEMLKRDAAKHATAESAVHKNLMIADELDAKRKAAALEAER
ncbi:toll-like receptor 4 [Haliotis cracherodii]|uniref:toll-like receptor 4 n=1 Tax=Haliotis cracherodii TaxID=6455 RepID=UPI0039E90AD0